MIGPQTLIPPSIASMGVQIYHDMQEGLRDVDVVIMLRIQDERMNGAFLPTLTNCFKNYVLKRS